MGQQDFWLRSKQQSVFKNAPVERLFSKTIARQQQFLPLLVPQGKGKHAVKVFHHRRAVFFIKMRQYFGIRCAAKRMATLFETAPQFPVVIDFTVKNYGNSLVFVEGGL